MHYEELKLNTARHFSSNIGRVLTEEAVDNILLALDNAYRMGKKSALEDQVESLKKVESTLDNTKKELKRLVADIRFEEEGYNIECQYEYAIERLLLRVEGW